MDLQEQLVDGMNCSVRQELAGNASSSKLTLYRLAVDADMDVRRALVLNPQTPPGALTILAVDADAEVRRIARERLVFGARPGGSAGGQSTERSRG